jgi:peptidoglycan/LPS O-acetylase OafA/YrhL
MQNEIDPIIIATERATAEKVKCAGGNFSPGIHGLRGLAALLVFVFHVYDLPRKLTVIPLPFWVQAAFRAMPAGVNIFFIISGYLITASLIRHANVRAFLLDRVARIYPVFLFLHLMLFLLAPVLKYKWLTGITPGEWVIHFVSNLLFLPGIFNLPLMQLNAWSLSYEAAFYLFSAAIYALNTRSRRVSLVLLFGGAPALIAIYPGAAFFAVGAFVFFLVNGTHSTLAATLPRLGIPSFFIFLFIMGYALTSEHIYAAWLAVPFGFFFFLDVVRRTPKISSVLESGFMQFFGTISYSFYLWQAVVTFPLKFAMVKILIGKWGMSPVPAMVVFGLVGLALTVPVSWLSWRILEKEGGRWLKARFARLERPTAVLP